ncbi:DUF1428 domain-containing protein [Candidatus Pacearchaeota archaeon CG_4_9_14_0_2_um_filter_39_13]|nr:DUF1428 domain-containing protein [Candidatus Pacearchaeota archaeon]PJC44301.1 MAG: DUF1428 domain-containing protein [Candidatus Pacearchaeota archaeon CG_4_9_14_0_2_um_filter_39_13]
MTYVDAFVLVVPKNKTGEYQKIARMAGKVWMKHGALSYKECIGDDLHPDMQGHKMLTFPQLTKLKKDEAVWYSFITYKNKGHRNKVNKAVMEEFKKNAKEHEDMMKDMQFDMKRMSYGGFKAVVDF